MMSFIKRSLPVLSLLIGLVLTSCWWGTDSLEHPLKEEYRIDGEKNIALKEGEKPGQSAQSTPAATEKLKDINAVIRTTKGDITVCLYATQTPLTVANFLNLAKKGYYNGIAFHRVIPDFMIQGGDPTGTGMGGPGYKFRDEIVPGLRHDSSGVLSMANSGPGTNGSQFFITHLATPWLDGKHTVFGKVLTGMDAVNNIRQGDKILEVKILGSTDALFAKEQENIKHWDQFLGN